MSRTVALEARLRALATLDEAIRALRTLSAQHFRAARAPIPAVRAYRDEVERFLGVLEDASPPERPAGIVLISADLGLIGDYAERLVRESLALRDERGLGPFVCLGRRALPPLARAGIVPDAVQPAPTSVAALPSLLLPLVDTLLGLRLRGELGELWLISARFEGAGAYTPVRTRVLPVAPPEDGPRISASPYGSSASLRGVVVREALYASLYESLLESLASEHGKRLVMAESALAWLEQRIDATRRLAAALRREASTQEVLELVAAARAAQRNRGEVR